MKSFEESFEQLAQEWVTPSRPVRDKEPRAATHRSGNPAQSVSASSPLTRTRPEANRGARGVESEPAEEEAKAAASKGEPNQEDRPGEADLSRVHPRLVCLLEPRSEHAESYYRLRYRLETRRKEGSALVVGVTSPAEGDGKTMTGINLAGALAKDASSRVLLLDLDFRRGGEGVAEYLGMASIEGEGVVDCIRGTEGGDEPATHFLEPFNLHVVTAGSEAELPYELLKSSRLDRLMERARRDYDFVIVDSPQILRLPDTELISRLVDGFLVVVRADETRQTSLEEALNLMTEDRVFGLVFNAVTEGL